MQSLHDKKYLASIVDLVPNSVPHKNGLPLKEPIDEKIVDMIMKSQILYSAPFLWLSVMHLFGEKNNLNPKFQRISKKYGDLSLSIELDSKILEYASENNLDLLKDIYMVAALEALIQVCAKYKLPDVVFRAERAKYRDIPNTIEECALGRLLKA